MTNTLAVNLVLAAVVFSAIIAIVAWAIRTARPSVAAPAPVHHPRVREHALRARAAHADRARAARRTSAPVGA
jgi:uncharacterized iron-regulated membrane protein